MTAVSTMPDDIYECYLLHEEGCLNGLLGITTRQDSRDLLLKNHQPMKRGPFLKLLAKMEPEQRASFEAMIRTPYAQLAEESRLRVEKVRHEYETDPDVRKRVRDEILARLPHRRDLT